nr:formylglycine-generating enzyme-like [Procambarus clarkii]XP_045620595.1 formylglycine-generating enzyme-like [Procambarus clarkii]XP_045620597.1 formylglycine-generating enzyme-like [Procambarus clarkii]XP_045620598.1 formylglycine-generating enzyme-like [Procambarus clarkii]
MSETKYWIMLFLGYGTINICLGNETFGTPQGNTNTSGSSCGCGSSGRTRSDGQVLQTDEIYYKTTEDYLTNQPRYKFGQAANVVDGSRRTIQMVEIPGGKFVMGTNDSRFHDDGETPVRWVEIDTFYMDVHEVSNADFEVFVKANSYETEAETAGESMVLERELSAITQSTIFEAVGGTPWWLPVKGASWDHPAGLDSNITSRMDHPVVHVSWNDAAAFCSWMGKRLPTEAEWERACRAGKHQRLYSWGNKFMPNNEYRANIWQGNFPKEDTGEDGCVGRCPVTSFPANGYGLHNMLGNVWEWTADWWGTRHSSPLHSNPLGPRTGETKVTKGGSYMCKQDTCYRYRCGARTNNVQDGSGGNVGFRCAADKLPDYLKN